MENNTSFCHTASIPQMNVMLKPSGSQCNLDCTYCFYLHKENLLHPKQKQRMSEPLLEQFIAQYIQQQQTTHITFYWQGGEPTLMGLDYYKKAVQLQRKYTLPGVTIDNNFQTNGILLNDDWCAFFKKHNFLIGLSIDGPQHLHNLYRKNKAGKDSYLQVRQAASLLHKYQVSFTTLTAVNRETARRPIEVYQFLRDEIRSPFIQFIPIVEPRQFRTHAPQCGDVDVPPRQHTSAARPGFPDSVVESWSVDPDEWGTFLSTVFDAWFAHDLGRVYVQYFEAAVELWMGLPSPLCILAAQCGNNLAMDFDGAVYSCDHFVYPEYRLGHLAEHTLAELANSPRQQQFSADKSATLCEQCQSCRYQFACFGECPKNRFIKPASGNGSLNYLCSGWKKFWTHIAPYISHIVNQLGYPVRKGL